MAEEKRKFSSNIRITRQKENEMIFQRKVFSLFDLKNIDIPSFEKFLKDKKSLFAQASVKLSSCKEALGDVKDLLKVLKSDEVQHIKYRKQTEEKILGNLNCDDNHDLAKRSKSEEFEPNYERAHKELSKYVNEFVKQYPDGKIPNNESSENKILQVFESVKSLIVEFVSKGSFLSNSEVEKSVTDLDANHQGLNKKNETMSGHYQTFLEKDNPAKYEQFRKDLACGRNFKFSEKKCESNIAQKPFSDGDGYCCFFAFQPQFEAGNLGHTVCINGECATGIEYENNQ